MEQHRRSMFLVLLIIVSLILLQAQQSCRPEPPQPTPIPSPIPLLTAAPTQTIQPTLTSSPTATMTPSATSQVLPEAGLESLAEIEYLGEGENNYTIPSGYYFLVKRHSPFRFDKVTGSTYQATANERVWRVSGAIPIKAYDQEVSFGKVWAGCEIKYVQIDDDPDSRRNRWYIDGKFVHLMDQGMVVNGRFSIPFAGKLVLNAEDSIGAEIDLTCPPKPTPIPPTLTPTRATPPSVGANTPNPPTPANPPETPATNEPIKTVTAVPADATITPTASPTVPQGPAYTRFNFEMAGHVGRNGICYMHRDTGELLLVWEMQDGWTDSATHPLADANGWIEVDIPHPSIYVEVYCDAGDGIVRMNIHNGVAHPDNGQIVGWLSRGVHNAIEIGWP